MSELARTSRTVETLVTHVKDRFLANAVLRNVEILDGLQNEPLNGAPPRLVFIVGDSGLQFANLCNVKGAFATLLETVEVRAWGLVVGGDYGQDARLAAIELLKDVAVVAHDSYGANVTGGTIEPAKETHAVKYGEYLALTLTVKCPVYRVESSVPAHSAGGTNGV
jgi:hypothetical protein